jgi:peptidyl-prolyl cis-trans isomerase D
MLIQKIREKIWIVILLVGIAMVIFLLQEAFTSSRSNLSKNVGEAAGEEISPQEFNTAFEQAEANYRQNGQAVDANTSWNLRQQTWDQLINQKVLGKLYEKTGIQVSDEELQDMFFGENPHNQVKQFFADQATGKVDRARVAEIYKAAKKNQEQAKSLADFENFLKQDRKYNKLTALLSNANYTPSWLRTETFKEQNQSVSGKVVVVPYQKIADNTITLSDNDFKAYIDKNKGKYNQEEETRVVEFVTFDVAASIEDKEKIKNRLAGLKEDFSKTNEDSAFVARNSDKLMDNAYSPTKGLSTFVKDTISKLAVGAVFGPYIDGKEIKLSKILGKKMIADSVKSRHILISAQNPASIDAANKKIDSIKALISSGKITFQDAAKKFSDDKSNNEKGGDLGFAAQGMFVKPFNDALFYDNNNGQIFKVTTQFGVHLVQRLDSKNPSEAVKLANIVAEITPSSETSRKAFQSATEFAGMYRTEETFKKGISAKDLTSAASAPLKITDHNVGTLGSAREVVRWAFSAEKGDISSVFNLDNKFAVALLKKVIPKGLPDVNDIRDDIKNQVMNEKKFEKLAESVKGLSMEQIAQKYGIEIKAANNVSFQSPFVPEIGYEPALGGTLFSTKSGATTAPFKGNSGLIVAKVESLNKMQDIPTPETVQNPLLSGFMNSMQQAIKEIGKVKDNRGKMF